jgi:molybdenum cofactor guanylyltransferase
MIQKNNITGIILAGGKSSRIGSDKGFLTLNDSTFISHIIKAIKPLVNDIIIVSNNSDYDIFNLKRVEDIIEDAGPLAGLCSGLNESETEYNLVLSCDVPSINSAVLNKLIKGFDAEKDVIQLKSKNKTMPLIALYNKQCMEKCMDLLQKGERRLRTVVEQFNTKTIELDPDLDQYVRNINTLSELKELRSELEH